MKCKTCGKCFSADKWGARAQPIGCGRPGFGLCDPEAAEIAPQVTARPPVSLPVPISEETPKSVFHDFASLPTVVDAPAAPAVVAADAPVKEPTPEAIDPFAVGELILPEYRIAGKPIDLGNAQVFPSIHVHSGAKSNIRRSIAESGNDLAGRQALLKWYSEQSIPDIQRLEGWHYGNGALWEIFHVPRGVPLNEWMIGKRVTIPFFDQLVATVSTALAAAHASPTPVVHLNICPTSIYIRESDTAYEITLAGWESARLVDKRNTSPIEPTRELYLPPEALIAKVVDFGKDVQSWDWWALGRTLQELLLRGSVLDKAQIKNPHKILCGLDKDVWPGMIEAMKPRPGPRCKMLLEGLLCANAKGRWKKRQIAEWLKGENPPTFYLEPTEEKIVELDGNPYKIADAAKFIITSKDTPTAVEHTFDAHEPHTLAFVVREVNSPRLTGFEKAAAELSALPFANESTNIHINGWKQQLASALFLSSIAGEEKFLVIGGARVDRAWLRGLIRNLLVPEFKNLKALNAGLDALVMLTGAGVVDRLSANGFVHSASEFRWVSFFIQDLRKSALAHQDVLNAADIEVVKRIVEIAVGPESDFRVSAKRTREQYPTSSHPWMREMFNKTGDSEYSALGIQMLAGAFPVHARLISKVRLMEEQRLRVEARTRELHVSACYQTLLRALQFGRLGFGNLFWCLLVAAGIGALVASALGLPYLSGPWIYYPAGVFAMRVVGGLIVRRKVSEHCPDAALVPFLGLTSHCANLGGKTMQLPQLRSEIDKANQELSTLAPAGTAPKRYTLPRPHALYLLGLTHLVVVSTSLWACFAAKQGVASAFGYAVSGFVGGGTRPKGASVVVTGSRPSAATPGVASPVGTPAPLPPIAVATAPAAAVLPVREKSAPTPAKSVVLSPAVETPTKPAQEPPKPAAKLAPADMMLPGSRFDGTMKWNGSTHKISLVFDGPSPGQQKTAVIQDWTHLSARRFFVDAQTHADGTITLSLASLNVKSVAAGASLIPGEEKDRPPLVSPKQEPRFKLELTASGLSGAWTYRRETAVFDIGYGGKLPAVEDCIKQFEEGVTDPGVNYAVSTYAWCGHAGAAYTIGRKRYMENKRLPASTYFEIALLSNHPEAARSLAVQILDGDLDVKDFWTGIGLLEKAANWGDTAAMVRLGKMYARGDGKLRQSENRAYSWFVDAARAGDAEGIYQVGRFLDTGGPVRSDIKKAAECFKQAADLGHADAADAYAKYFETGTQFNSKDSKVAAKYRELAKTNRAKPQPFEVR